MKNKCPACKAEDVELIEVWPAAYLCKECWPYESWRGKPITDPVKINKRHEWYV